MNTYSIQHSGLAGVAVKRDDERISIMLLRLPVTSSNSAKLEALKFVYAEVLRAGSGTLTREKFLDALSLLGSDIDVNPTTKSISIVLNSLDTSLLKTLKILKVMFERPTFDISEIKRIKELLINQLIMSKEDSKGRSYQNFMTTLTHKTDSRHVFSAEELISQINNISVNEIRAFHLSLWDNEWTMTCGGSHKSCIALEKAILDLRRKRNLSLSASPKKVTPIPVLTREIKLIDIPHRQNIEFSIGNVLPLQQNDSEFAAFVFGLSVLGIYGGFTGRLMSIVREKEGLTYSIYGQTEGSTKYESGFWRIATFFNPKDSLRGVQATLREISRIKERGITSDELIRFKAILATRKTLIEDSIIKKVIAVHSRLQREITKIEFEAFTSDIQGMTCTRVNSALRKYLDPRKLLISGAGPIKSVKNKLLAFSNEIVRKESIHKKQLPLANTV